MPTLFSVKPEKVATPLEAVAVRVPPSAAPEGLFARATVTEPSNDAAVSPAASSTVTTRPKAVPTETLPGWVVTASFVAAELVTLKDVVVEEVKPLEENRSVSPLPGWLSVRSENVATPLAAVAVRVPPSVAPEGLFARATATEPEKDVARSPEPSSASMTTVNTCPWVTFAGGCVVTTSWVAVTWGG